MTDLGVIPYNMITLILYEYCIYLYVMISPSSCFSGGRSEDELNKLKDLNTKGERISHERRSLVIDRFRTAGNTRATVA